MWTDSHAHLTSVELLPHAEILLTRAQAAGVHTILNICTNLETLKHGLELAQRFPWVYNAASITPHDVETEEAEPMFLATAKHARAGHLRAVGETGLDYFHHFADPVIQKKWCRQYLQLALECNLPVVIHCREAFADFFELIDTFYQVNGKYAPGVLHCFTGTMQEAEGVLSRGWYLSLSGIVTFKKSEMLKQIAKEVPLDQLFIETDAPYLAPQSHRGEVNEPAYVVETAQMIAQIKGISPDEVAAATTRNLKNFLKL